MTAPANLRGWGQGWPVNRQPDMRLVIAARSGARWFVHYEIAPIVQHVVNTIESRGYLFDHGPSDVDDDWGYANRPIRGRRVASNHSWGLAIDIDAQEYPMGTHRNPPAWIIGLFEQHGFEWGGRWSRPDPMHFEFQGWPSDARRIAASLTATPPPVRPAPPVVKPATKRRRQMTFVHITDASSKGISSDTWFHFDGFRARPMSSPAQAQALYRVGAAPEALVDSAGNVRPRPMTWGEFNGTVIVPGAT